MDKFLKILFSFLIIISHLSCTVPSKLKPVKKDLDQIIKTGKIIAITGYNPYSYFIYKGQPMGYDYELVKKFADALHLKVDFLIERDINSMFNMLNNGKGDIIAYNLTVTNERTKRVAFSHRLRIERQVLVQRRPKNWRRMKIHNIESKLIRSPLDLEGKTIYIEKGSSYRMRLEHLMDEIGGKINIIEADSSLTTDDLIKMVADGKIKYTVADEDVGRLNQAYYTNIDVKTYISFPQKIAWAVRKNSPKLLDTLNWWIDKSKKEVDFYAIYKKYFTDRQAFRKRIKSEYFSFTGGKISQYDELIKKYAKQLGWDWRLLASLIYQESQFNPKAKSWAGAVGLMQLIPVTAKKYGAKNPYDPKQSLTAGFRYLKRLDKFWSKYIKDKTERTKFVIASYNIGFGHILDARKLAEKYGANPDVWDNNVEKFLLKKSEPKYYNDSVVKNGYCSGIETVDYVRQIFDRYNHYKRFIS